MNNEEVKAYLLQIQKLKTIRDNKTDELRKLWAKAEYPNAPVYGTERVQTSGGGQKLAHIIDDCIIKESELKEDIRRLTRATKEIESVIEKLELMEYKVIYERYINFNDDFNMIAEKLNISYSWATSLHGKALKNLGQIIQAERKAGD